MDLQKRKNWENNGSYLKIRKFTVSVPNNTVINSFNA